MNATPRTGSGGGEHVPSEHAGAIVRRILSKRPLLHERKKYPVTPRDLLSRKRAPIWLGPPPLGESPSVTVPAVAESLSDGASSKQQDLAVTIERLEKTGEEETASGRYVEAAESFEQAFGLRVKMVGLEHPHTVLLFEFMADAFCIWGMRCLNAGQTINSLELLKKAESVTEIGKAPYGNYRRAVLRTTTFSCLCCYFRSRGKTNAAVQVAERGLRLDKQYKDFQDVARLRINYAVLLHSLGRFGESVEQTEMALASLRQQGMDGAMLMLKTVSDSDKPAPLSDSDKPAPPETHTGMSDPDKPAPMSDSNRPAPPETHTAIVVAYHNLWVHHARLSQWIPSGESLIRAANFARQNLGQSHPLTMKIESSLDATADVVACTGLEPSPRTRVVESESPCSTRPGASSAATTCVSPLGSWQYTHTGASNTPATMGTPMSRASVAAAFRAGTSCEQVHMSASCLLPTRPHTSAAIHSRDSKQWQSETSRSPRARAFEREELSVAKRLVVSTDVTPSRRRRRPPGDPERGGTPFLDMSRDGVDVILPPRPTTVQGKRASLLDDDEIFDAHQRAFGRKAHPFHDHFAVESFPLQRRDVYSKDLGTACLGFVESQQQKIDQFEAGKGRRSATPASGGPAENRRRDSFMIVHTAKRDFVQNRAAMQIQAMWRGYNTRRHVHGEVARQEYESAVKLQAGVRRFFEFKRAQKRKQAAIKVQKRWRGHMTYKWYRSVLVSREMEKRRKSVALFWAMWSGCKVRKENEEKKRIRVVQALIRGVFVRREIARWHAAAQQIQTAYHRFMLKLRYDFHIAQAKLIQKHNRRHQVCLRQRTIRCKVVACQRAWRGFYTRRKMDRQDKIALMLQAFWYKTVAKMQRAIRLKAAFKVTQTTRLALSKMRTAKRVAAVLRISSFYCGKSLRTVLFRREWASVTIQRWYRGWPPRALIRVWKRNSCTAQRCWRRYIGRSRIKRVHAAAQMLQQAWLCTFNLRQWRRGVRRGVVTLQALFRARVGRNLFLNKRRVALAIQSACRGSCVRKRIQANAAAAREIQLAWLRNRTIRRTLELKTAANRIQAWTSNVLIRMRLARRANAVSKIQRIVRLIAFRRKLAASIHKRIAFLGSWIRAVAVRRWYLEIKTSTISLQRAWRVYTEKCQFARLKELSSRIRGHVRRYADRRKVNQKLAACVVIQASWRRRLASSFVRQLRSAANVIQRHVRRMITRIRSARQKTAAFKIQRMVGKVRSEKRTMQRRQSHHRISRMVRCRRAHSGVQRMHYSASMVGSIARMYLCRRQLAIRHRLTITVQRFVRGHIARKHVRRVTHRAPVEIQTFYRRLEAIDSVEARRALTDYLDAKSREDRQRREEAKREVAVTQLQAWIRSILVSWRYRGIMIPAALRVQSLWRMYDAKRHSVALESTGALVRGYMLSRRTLTVSDRKVAVIKVQQAAKKWFIRRCPLERNSWHMLVAACVRIQRCFQRWLRKRIYRRQCKAATVIQSVARWRGTRLEAMRRHRAAIIIQTCAFRTPIARRRAADYRREAGRICRFARRVVAARRLAVRQKVALPLQAMCRSKIRRWHLQRSYQAAAKIQAYYRMLRHRIPHRANAASHRRRAILVIQSVWRDVIVFRRVRGLQVAATRIQQKVRYSRFRTSMARFRDAAVTIIRVWRGRKCAADLQRRVFLLRKVAGRARGWCWRGGHFGFTWQHYATHIQKFYRGTCSREETILKMISAVSIQTAWRGYLKRVWYQKVHRLAAILRLLMQRWRYQKLIRGHNCLVRGTRKVLKTRLPVRRRMRMVQNAITIQRVFRGHFHRKLITRMKIAAGILQALARKLRAQEVAPRRTAGVCRIQARFRGIVGRRETARRKYRLFSVQHPLLCWAASRAKIKNRKGAICIQRIYRGFTVRKRSAKVEQAALILTKSAWAAMERRRYLSTLVTIRYVQKSVRRYFERKRLWHRNGAALRIQTWLRKCLIRWSYRRHKQAAATCVSGCRMWCRRRSKQQQLQAAVHIGAWWRGYCVRYNRRMLTQNIDKIRSWWRWKRMLQESTATVQQLMWARRRVKRVYSSLYAVTIQTWWRRQLAMNNGLRKLRKSILTIQSNWRRALAMDEVKSERILQGFRLTRLPSQLVALVADKRGKLSRYRAFRPRERTTVQRTRLVRMRILSRNLRAHLEVVLAPLVSFTKFWILRRKLRLIQKNVRGWLCRRALLKKHRAAAIIQAFVREKNDQGLTGVAEITVPPVVEMGDPDEGNVAPQQEVEESVVQFVSASEDP